MTNDNSRLVNRMSSAKTLQSFSGDPLDWPRFKQAFELSTSLGDYSDRENIMRLSEALKGDAHAAARALFVAGHSSQEIMTTLEMRFGNTNIILKKILFEIRNLPSIELQQISLIEFATKLRGAVLAIKSLNNNLGYLYSPELVNSLIKKLPSSMYYNFVRFAANEGKNKPDLERISDFVYREAEMSIAAGVISYEPIEATSEKPKILPQSSRNAQKAVCATSVNESSEDGEVLVKRNRNCTYCNLRGHNIWECRKFERLTVDARWKALRAARLCYNCFGEGHSRNACKKEPCTKCTRKHHPLLHPLAKTRTEQTSMESSNQTATKNLNSRGSGACAEVSAHPDEQK